MRAVMAPSAVIALLSLAACRIQDPFACTLDEHCGSGGTCEPVGYCSFTDTSCPDGRRYDELAGDDLAGQCVDLGCAPGYLSRIAGSGSRYRIVATAAPWPDAQNDCADDGRGTHLVVIGSEAERTGVAGLLRADIWIGYSDRKTEGSFLWVTRASSTFAPWDGGGPEDLDGTEDCAQMRRQNSAWQDRSCTETFAYICECDGVAADPTAY